MPKKSAMLRICYNHSQDVLHICSKFTTLTHNWLTYALDWLQLAKPILSQSARSLGRATTTIVRFSINIADSVRAPARVPFSSYIRDYRALQDQECRHLILTISQCCHLLLLFVVTLSSCLCTRPRRLSCFLGWTIHEETCPCLRSAPCKRL